MLTQSGTLQEHTVAEIIRDLYKDHIDGVLSVRQQDVEKQIFFAYGSPIFATSNQRDDRMRRREHLQRVGRGEQEVIGTRSRELLHELV